MYHTDFIIAMIGFWGGKVSIFQKPQFLIIYRFFVLV